MRTLPRRGDGAGKAEGPGAHGGMPGKPKDPAHMASGPSDGAGLLLDDLGDRSGTDGPAALTDGEAETLFDGDRLDERHGHLGGVARHDHLGALGEGDDTGHVRGAEEELRAVIVEERRMAAAFV